MKIVVIGGTGRIGSKIVAILRQRGEEVIAASPQRGVNTVTGEGLKEALLGSRVVIDVSNAPSNDADSALEFFEVSGRNLLTAEAAAGVQHHVALSIVGTDRVPGQGYYRAKLAQEKLIEASGVPYTIIRATQFLEFLAGIADANTDGSVVRIPRAYFSQSRLTMLLPSSPRWRSVIRETGLSRSQVRNERRSTKSSRAI